MTISLLEDAVRRLLSDDCDITKLAPVFQGNRVLLRADLNVPLSQDGSRITDENRINALLPTLSFLLDAGAKVAIASHFGRPQPQKQSREAMLASAHSLRIVSSWLLSRLGHVRFTGLAPDCVGPQAHAKVDDLKPGQVGWMRNTVSRQSGLESIFLTQACLLENTRFHVGEVDNDPEFSRALAELCDIFVCDAFGVMHRDQASVTVRGQMLSLIRKRALEAPSFNHVA